MFYHNTAAAAASGVAVSPGGVAQMTRSGGRGRNDGHCGTYQRLERRFFRCTIVRLRAYWHYRRNWCRCSSIGSDAMAIGPAGTQREGIALLDSTRPHHVPDWVFKQSKLTKICSAMVSSNVLRQTKQIAAQNRAESHRHRRRRRRRRADTFPYSCLLPSLVLAPAI